MKMPALVRAKNTVTVSIIINFLVRAPHANVTTGHAAQSKGFRSGKRQSDPTDDFEQQRRAPGQKPPLKGHADPLSGNRRGRHWSRPAGAVSECWITAFSRSVFNLPTRKVLDREQPPRFADLSGSLFRMAGQLSLNPTFLKSG
jgi:hypothetical protein